MAQGRCPGGCGETGSIKAVTSHMAGCARYAQRFAAGEELRDPAEEFRLFAAERKPAATPRAPRAPRPEPSDPGATVPPAPKRPTRREAPAGEPGRVSEPVRVEYWQVPQTL